MGVSGPKPVEQRYMRQQSNADRELMAQHEAAGTAGTFAYGGTGTYRPTAGYSPPVQKAICFFLKKHEAALRELE